ncbi:hypothetical protein [Mycolicibacterium llatzerense]|uniref:hypothetical protein n=1 Tax=Mycolicibacterium llatzerense TaxID=280871 RepID=UPI0008DC6ACD|nr:hypothetical protein [Mycolicibacterium llatzerense]
MSAVASGMPSRRFSAAILTGAWPQTDPATCQSLSSAQRKKAVELLGCADQIRTTAADVSASQSGKAIDAFHTTSTGLASTITGQADRYFAMAQASSEVGHILQGLRTDLNQIDSQAHQQIDQILRSSTGATAVIAQTQIVQVIANARAAASAKSASAATAIADQASHAGLPAPGHGPGGADTPMPGQPNGIRQAGFKKSGGWDWHHDDVEMPVYPTGGAEAGPDATRAGKAPVPLGPYHPSGSAPVSYTEGAGDGQAGQAQQAAWHGQAPTHVWVPGSNDTVEKPVDPMGGGAAAGPDAPGRAPIRPTPPLDWTKFT